MNTVGLKLFAQNTFVHLELVTIRTFYITHSKFQFDRHLLFLYVNKADFLYASKYTQSNSSVLFGMIRWE